MVEPRKTRANGRASRDELVSVAAEIFARNGYRGTTLKQISTTAGMTLQGLLHHFPTKHDLLLEVVRVRELVVERDPFEDGPPRDFSAKVLDMVQFLSDASVGAPVQQLLLMTLVTESLDPEHPLHAIFVERYRRVRAVLANWVVVAQQAGQCRLDIDPQTFARESIAIMDGLQLQWLLDPEGVDLAEALNSWGKKLAQDLALTAS